MDCGTEPPPLLLEPADWEEFEEPELVWGGAGGAALEVSAFALLDVSAAGLSLLRNSELTQPDLPL